MDSFHMEAWGKVIQPPVKRGDSVKKDTFVEFFLTKNSTNFKKMLKMSWEVFLGASG